MLRAKHAQMVRRWIHSHILHNRYSFVLMQVGPSASAAVCTSPCWHLQASRSQWDAACSSKPMFTSRWGWWPCAPWFQGPST